VLHFVRRPRWLALALIAGAAAFLYVQTFTPFLQHADTDAYVGDGAGAWVLRVVPTVIFPATAGLVGFVAYHRTRGKVFEASLATLLCALTLEVIATLWLAAGSVIP
jgi:hypothetical protein